MGSLSRTLFRDTVVAGDRELRYRELMDWTSKGSLPRTIFRFTRAAGDREFMA
jgi:hypothetical protein